MSNAHIRFQDDDDNSEYNPSDSDNDYTENEKNLLQKVRNRRKNDSESDDEVYGVASDDDDDDDEASGQSNIALSDVEGQEEDDDLPNIRAWGKDKRKFYSTDFIDPDYGGFEGKTATLAEIEEEEAKNLQKQLVQELDDGDFSLEMFVKKKESDDKKELEEVVKTDISKLSRRQKLQLLKQESPEFFELIEDYKVKMQLAKDMLKPTITLSKDNKIKECEALNFVKLYYRLILNYCTNISMYLLLKSSKVSLKNHPIVKRLFQYRQHLSQMDPIYDEVIKPQLEVLLNERESVDDLTKKKTLKLLTKLKNVKEKESETRKITDTNKTNDDNEIEKHVKFADMQSDEEKSSKPSEDEDGNAPEDDKTTDEKRAITYQMSKNKGLMPYRKKEQRNPRVKHRNKFRKALIRRKGAVREVRRELSKYGGEMSGIKASVTKSIKIKG